MNVIVRHFIPLYKKVIHKKEKTVALLRNWGRGNTSLIEKHSAYHPHSEKGAGGDTKIVEKQRLHHPHRQRGADVDTNLIEKQALDYPHQQKGTGGDSISIEKHRHNHHHRQKVPQKILLYLPILGMTDFIFWGIKGCCEDNPIFEKHGRHHPHSEKGVGGDTWMFEKHSPISSPPTKGLPGTSRHSH